MKKLTVILISFFSLNFAFGQTYSENFDENSNWSGGSSNSYNAKEYTLPNPLHNDKFSTNYAVKETSNTYSSGNAWRLKKTNNVYLRYECEGTVTGFTIYAARWDNSPKPNITVRYSIDSGTNYTTAFTFNGDDFAGDKTYQEFSYTFSSPITNNTNNKIYSLHIGTRKIRFNNLKIIS